MESYKGTLQRLGVRLYISNKSMKLRSNTMLAIFSWLAVPITSSEITTKVKNLLRAPTPLALLWGEKPPLKLENENRLCWMSTFERNANDGGISVTIQGDWTEDPKSQNARLQRSKAEFVLRLSEVGGTPRLTVEPIGNDDFTNLIRGYYDILYASRTCFLIRGPKGESGNGICTVWVLASTANHMHTACRQAFTSQCTTDGQCG
ncbi:uncharacterized protein LOC142564345 isoform X2 [Dermacentor variabilis]|uniref:uncharacterized protein LOC142564345 isoform X2 n=1 Tax=Dermacentor variabilis TaxID=34621 RepID=UPI003F5C6D3A